MDKIRVTVARFGVVGIVGLLAGPVFAQEDVGTAARGIAEEPARFFSAENFSLQVGGGFTSFTEATSSQLSRLGGTWLLRGIFGSTGPVGVEADYFGTARGVRATDGDGGSVVSNGLDALARVGYPFHRGAAFMVPYLTAGVGLSLYGSTGIDTATSGIGSTDLVFEIPVGLGVSGGVGRFVADLRFLYRPSFGGDLFRNAPGAETSGEDNIAVTLTGGYRF
jgi:hypothetical protein